MRIFKTSLRIIVRHWIYIAIYLVTLSVMGLFVTLGYSDQSGFAESTGRVAIIDRDHSPISRGLSDYLAKHSVAGFFETEALTPVEDSTEALADLIAQDIVSYVVIIPEGYGKNLIEAASGHGEIPALETSISYQSGSGSIFDLRLRQYLQSVYGYAATNAQNDQARATELANEAMSHKAAVDVITTELAKFPERLIGYFAWCTYPLFTAVTILVSVLMKSLNKDSVSKRMNASPVTARSRSRQTFLACVVLGVVSWAWVVSLGIAASGVDIVAGGAVQLALMAYALLCYALVSVSIGFLLGQLGVGEMAANAIGNVGGLVFSFLGGAWMPLELLDEGVQAAGHLTPSYWAGQAVNSAQNMASVSLENALPSLLASSIVLAFAVAFTLIAFAAGRARTEAL